MQSVIIRRDMKEEKKYFNSLNHSTENVSSQNEFDEKLPLEAMWEHADTLSASSTSRRDFLKFLGFGTLAATIASCEAPVVKSIPYLNKPEEITPGNPLYYASSYFAENTFASLLVKTREGRRRQARNRGWEQDARHRAETSGGIRWRSGRDASRIWRGILRQRKRAHRPFRRLRSGGVPACRRGH